jgi:predicted ATPase
VSISGFKSIAKVGMELKPLNVLIGANAAGKTNFVSAFKLLNYMLTDGLQLYIGRAGGANSLLHYGPKTTTQLEMVLEYETETGKSTYAMRLADAAPDTLIFVDEKVSYHNPSYPSPQEVFLEAGHKESHLNDSAYADNRTVGVLRYLLGRCRVYQFHDTSDSSPVRKSVYVDESKYLRSDGGNLAAYLLALKANRPEHYRRIVETIRRAVPSFGDFELEPDRLNPDNIMLNWREIGSEYLFGPHHLSDGTLRFMALSTLLLQPEDDLPHVLILDEPELGLHPNAISILASLVRKLSSSRQIVLATQSVYLVDQFDPEDVVVVERQPASQGGSNGRYVSVFKRLDPDPLKDWLQEYALGTLWAKGVLGGKPS